jgi:hypothetical protein
LPGVFRVIRANSFHIIGQLKVPCAPLSVYSFCKPADCLLKLVSTLWTTEMFRNRPASN